MTYTLEQLLAMTSAERVRPFAEAKWGLICKTQIMSGGIYVYWLENKNGA